MSLEFIERYSSKHCNSGKKEKSDFPPNWASKLTHLFMNGKHIPAIEDLSICPFLKVLYLHTNEIKRIEGLNRLKLLTHLYLQWNKIEKIENLNKLRSLKKLYLGHNNICTLENLEGLNSLEELHIEHQTLPKNVSFEFDEESLPVIAHSLRVLNISGLHLKNLSNIQVLLSLQRLIAIENDFSSPEEIGENLKQIPFLVNVDVHSCPAQKDLHYREKISAGAYQVEVLDGKPISRYTRQFIRNLERRRNARGSYQSDARDTSTKSKSHHTLSAASSDVCFSFRISTADGAAFKSWNSLTTPCNRKSRSAMAQYHRKPIPKTEKLLKTEELL